MTIDRPPPPDPARTELEHHLQERIDELVESGLPRDEARRKAMEVMGDLDKYRRQLERMDRRERRRLRARECLAATLQDLRTALRGIGQRPGFAATVILTLALGIGVNLALFGIVDAVLLHPIPLPEPERLIRVYQAGGGETGTNGVSYPNWRDLKAGTTGVDPLAAWGTTEVGVRVGERTERLTAAAVSGDYFEALGNPVSLGRGLFPEDTRRPGGRAVVVLGDRLWSRLFQRDPGVVGRDVEIGGALFTVVGVASPSFTGLDLSAPVALWIPLPGIQDVVPASSIYSGHQIYETRAFPWLSLVGRLDRATSRERAITELVGAARSIIDTHGNDANMGTDGKRPVVVLPVESTAVMAGRDTLVDLLVFLIGIVGVTLVLVCINVASLLLARARSRSGEMAIRRSLGASRGRLARQLLTESLVLALFGAAAGVGVAALTHRLLVSFTLPGGVALAGLDLGLDGRGLAVACFLALGCGLGFGAAPAWRCSAEGAGRRSRTASSSAGGRGLRSLLVAQVAVSVVLIVGAGLFARSVQRGLAVDTGLDVEGVTAVSFGLSAHGYTSSEAGTFSRRLLDRLEGLPGVERAAIASHVPLAPTRMAFRLVPDESSREERVPIHVNVIDGGYFALLGIESVDGRLFESTDGGDADDVAILNRSAARALWPDRPALGRSFAVMPGLPPVRVVGIVEDAMAHSVADAGVPYAYLPASQAAGMGFAEEANAMVRTRSGVDAVALLRSEIDALEPSLPVYGARSVDEQVGQILAPQRFGARLVGLLALVALLVSAVGIHGTAAYIVSTRRHEIGIRAALGALPARILRHVVGGEGVALATGLVLGLLASVYAARSAESLLFGIEPIDPVAFAAGALLLIVVAAIALIRPVRAALQVDPRRVLSEELPRR